MKYNKPQLYRLFPSNISDAFCGSGNNAGTPLACQAGPEAGNGCSAGAAAGGRCVPGAAAGTECNSGAGFEIQDQSDLSLIPEV